MAHSFTALVRKDGEWWVGWVAEIPGVVAQEKSRDALLETLNTALGEALDHTRRQAQIIAPGYDTAPLNQ